jgi:uracil-DNA glycosylase
MRVLIVGSNPSTSSPTGDPFDPSTRSYKTIQSWFKDIPNVELIFCNVCDSCTPNNKPLSMSQIKENAPTLFAKLMIIQAHRIVAVGATANKALDLFMDNFFALPHPSGRCRIFNDPLVKNKMLSDLRRFVCSE